jgi:hypothetical protein
MRNSFTDLAQEALKQNDNLNDKQKPDVLSYAGGWSKNSKQPARYSAAWLNAQVERVLASVQNIASGLPHDPA